MVLRALQQHLAAAPQPSIQALMGGMEILQTARLQRYLQELSCPVFLIHGSRDALVPVAATHAMKTLQPQAELRLIPDGTHAPFLTHPKSFIAALNDCLDDSD
jgi:pimeloyl-[acyl-carrier protein] methyl ester esterase